MMGIKEALYGICFQNDKVSHLGKKMFLPGLIDNILYILNIQDPQNITAELTKTRWVFPVLEKKVFQIF